MMNENNLQLLNTADYYFRKNNYTLAEDILKKVIKNLPNNSKANELLGYIYGNQGNLDLSFQFLKIASEQDDCTAEALYYYGSYQLKRHQYEQAIGTYKKSIEKAGVFFEALHDLGTAYGYLGKTQESLSHYEACLNLNNNSYELYFNIGKCLDDLRRYDEALKNYDQAITIKPDYAEAWSNKGAVLNDLKRYDEALTHYEQAIKITPSYSEALFNKAILNLYLKRFKEGWLCYEARLDCKNLVSFEYPLSINIIPVWDGIQVCKHLLVVAEQGIGDEIFYISALNQLQSMIQNISVVADKRLLQIFSRSFPAITFLEKNSTLDNDLYDAQIPIGSLMGILNITPSKDQGLRAPYLIDDSELSFNLRNSRNFKGKFTCGISWKSFNKKIGDQKSIHLPDLKGILEVDNCDFINLQYGDVFEDIKITQEATGVQLKEIDGIDIFSNIDGLLSIINSCDVVVTTSNITAHLAGAIGKKTLLLLPYSKGRTWYWHEEEVSMWYPSIKQFFQSSDLTWDDAINNIARELRDEIERKN